MPYTQTETDAAVTLDPAAPAQCTVVWLHGLGADGHDFVPIVPELHLPDSLAVRFVFPQAPVRPVTINNGYAMRAWYDIRSMSAADRANADHLDASTDLVHGLIRSEIARGIDSRRMIVAGFSQGGAIALHAALSASEPLAGVLALSTYLPLPERLLGRDRRANASVPILQCHGIADAIVTPDMAVAAREALLAAGYALEWRSYAMEHEVIREELTDIGTWLRARLA